MQKTTLVALASVGLLAGALGSVAKAAPDVDPHRDVARAERGPKSCSGKTQVEKLGPALHGHLPT